MKSITKILFVAGLAYAMAASASFGQVITFDENGHGSIPGFGPLPFFVGPDPSGGLPVNVLVYTLPFQVTPGDVGLLESPVGSTNLVLSDIVRFVTPAGGNTSEMIFYSDFSATDPADAIADTGLPQSPNAFLIQEVGPEGNNGAVWTPTPGEPGFAPTGSLQYNIISDVPEPGTLTLAALGGGLVLAALRRRQGKM